MLYCLYKRCRGQGRDRGKLEHDVPPLSLRYTSSSSKDAGVPPAASAPRSRAAAAGTVPFTGRGTLTSTGVAAALSKDVSCVAPVAAFAPSKILKKKFSEYVEQTDR